MSQNQFQSPAPQLRAYKGNLWEEQIHFAARRVTPDGTVLHGLQIGFIEFPNMEGVAQPPILTLNPQAAQVLMDDLWQCGLRPTEGKGTAGQLAATEAHLKDMQTISFKFIEKARL